MLLNKLIFVTITILAVSSCIQKKNQDAVRKNENKKNENEEIQKDCEAKTIDINLSSPLEFIECVDKNLDIWENVIETKIIFETDTLDVIKVYELYFKNKAENLSFIDFKQDKKHFIATYYYSGCVGDFCKQDLKLEFEFDKNGKLHVTDLYDFDEETETRIEN